ncbi:hypothetical protein HanPSC8_Chr06g0240121 [Helianthus annuus]|nr:hypothetical protein HanPSC8_Chr06g0240121 [Helianthus annuus]
MVLIWCGLYYLATQAGYRIKAGLSRYDTGNNFMSQVLYAYL